MEDYQELLHVRFAEQVMGWINIELSREGGGLKFFGTIYTNRGPARREVPDYSNDLNAMWGAEQYLRSIGLLPAYIEALARICGAHDLTNQEDLFKLISASPAQRCEAGLLAYQNRETS
jgi:hypothetical protein